MIKSLIASLHFTSLHFTLKIISMSKLTRQKFLQDLDPSISSTSSKLACRLRLKSQLVETSSKLTCRLNLSTQLVDSTCRLNLSIPLQTHLLTPLETSTLADFIQTHLSTQPVDFIQTQLVSFIQTHSSTLPETPRKSQLVDLVDSTRKSHLPIISKISTLIRCFKHPLKSQRLRSSRLVESLNLKVLPAVVELSPASLQNFTRRSCRSRRSLSAKRSQNSLKTSRFRKRLFSSTFRRGSVTVFSKTARTFVFSLTLSEAFVTQLSLLLPLSLHPLPSTLIALL